MPDFFSIFSLSYKGHKSFEKYMFINEHPECSDLHCDSNLLHTDIPYNLLTRTTNTDSLKVSHHELNLLMITRFKLKE